MQIGSSLLSPALMTGNLLEHVAWIVYGETNNLSLSQPKQQCMELNSPLVKLVQLDVQPEQAMDL